MDTIEIMTRYLSLLKVPHTAEFISRKLSDMPDGDSMFGMSLLLSEYGIPNHCLRLETIDLKNIDMPFITIAYGQFIIAEIVESSEVRMTNSSGATSTVSLENFVHFWNHTVLMGLPTEKSSEPEFDNNIRKRKQSSILKFLGTVSTIMLSLVAILNDHKGGFLRFSLLALNMLGIYITFLLLQKDLDIPNKVSARICGLVKKNDCSDVTQSSAATIMGTIHLSEIGAAFFLINTLALLLSHDTVPFVSLAAVFSLPFITWSVAYQKFKLHGWCVLCLLTAMILFLQAIVSIICGNIQEMTSPDAICAGGIVGFGYILSCVAINILMKYLRKSIMLPQCEHAYYSLKGKEFVIDGYLRWAPSYDVSEDICSSLVFGNPKAKNWLTIISNPYCYPCSMLHRHIESWPGNELAIQCVFTSFSKEREDINRALIAAYRKLGSVKTWEILCEWFGEGKEKGINFFNGYCLDSDNAEIDYEMAKQERWFMSNGFTSTPTVLINGKEIKPPYGIEDYHYLKQ